MKYLSILFVLIASKVSAQTIELRANGFTDRTDSLKTYVVAEFPKMTKTDLYKKTLTYLNSIYKNPAAVLTSVEGESITVNGLTNSITGGNKYYSYNYSYNILIQFKEGKIRFEPKFIKLIEDPSPSPKREVYLRNTDSPNKVEISCVFMKAKNGEGYWALEENLQRSLSVWANNYLSEIKKALNDNW